MNAFDIGDKVQWDTPQGPHRGTVVDRCAQDFNLARQRFTASEENPAYIVESEDTGAAGAHRGQALQPA